MQASFGETIHTKKTFYAGLFQRLKPKIKAKGAAWAVAHRMAKVIWLVLHEEVEYQEKGPALPNQRTLTRKLRTLVREFSASRYGRLTLLQPNTGGPCVGIFEGERIAIPEADVRRHHRTITQQEQAGENQRHDGNRGLGKHERVPRSGDRGATTTGACRLREEPTPGASAWRTSRALSCIPPLRRRRMPTPKRRLRGSSPPRRAGDILRRQPDANKRIRSPANAVPTVAAITAIRAARPRHRIVGGSAGPGRQARCVLRLRSTPENTGNVEVCRRSRQRSSEVEPTLPAESKDGRASLSRSNTPSMALPARWERGMHRDIAQPASDKAIHLAHHALMRYSGLHPRDGLRHFSSRAVPPPLSIPSGTQKPAPRRIRHRAP